MTEFVTRSIHVETPARSWQVASPCKVCNVLTTFERNDGTDRFSRLLNEATTCDACVTAAQKPFDERPRVIPMEEEIPGRYRDADRDELKPATREVFDHRVRTTAFGADSFIVGATGAGKTYAAALLAKIAIAESIRPCFTTGEEIKSSLTPTTNEETRERRQQRQRRFNRCRWLCIDDLGHGNWTPTYAELIRDLLDARLGDASKTTIITSQFPTAKWTTEVKHDCQATIAAITRRLDDMTDHWKL